MIRSTILAVAATFGWQPAFGDTVNFAVDVNDICVVEIASEGALALEMSGAYLSSGTPGGAHAVVSIAAAGHVPTLHFSAPKLTGPARSVAAAKVLMGYTSKLGINQPPVAAPNPYVLRQLRDTITVQGRANSDSGFESGRYAILSTLTCQQ